MEERERYQIQRAQVHQRRMETEQEKAKMEQIQAEIP